MTQYIEELVQNIYTNCDMRGLEQFNKGVEKAVDNNERLKASLANMDLKGEFRSAVEYARELRAVFTDLKREHLETVNLQKMGIDQSKLHFLSEKQRIDLMKKEHLARLDMLDKEDKVNRRIENREKAGLRHMQHRNGLQRYFNRLLLSLVSIHTLRSIINTGAKLQLTQKSIEGLTGSKQDWDFIVAKAREFGISLDTISKGYKNFYAAASMAGFDKGGIQQMYADLILSARAIGASETQIGGALLAIEQMMSKGRISMEELRRQLGNALPGAFEVGAKAMGVTTAEFNKMVKAGLTAQEFVPKFIQTYKEQYAKGWVDVEQTVSVALGRLGVAWEEFTLQFTSGDTGKAFAKAIDEIRLLLYSPEFKQLLQWLGQLTMVLSYLFRMAIRNSQLLLGLLGVHGMVQVITRIGNLMQIIQKLGFEKTLMEYTGNTMKFYKSMILLYAKAGLVLLALAAIQDLIYGIFFPDTTESLTEDYFNRAKAQKENLPPGVKKFSQEAYDYQRKIQGYHTSKNQAMLLGGTIFGTLSAITAGLAASGVGLPVAPITGLGALGGLTLGAFAGNKLIDYDMKRGFPHLAQPISLEKSETFDWRPTLHFNPTYNVYALETPAEDVLRQISNEGMQNALRSLQTPPQKYQSLNSGTGFQQRTLRMQP